MKRKTKGCLLTLRAFLATAACAGLAGLGIGSVRATVIGLQQLPGHGSVVGGSASTTGHYGAGGTGHIQVTAPDTVINWGNTGGTIGTNQPGGFNIGGSAHLTITGGHGTSLLNVDVTGNPSQILGMMNTNMPTFIANANGIIVGPSASIVAPAGLGLIAATVNERAFATTGQLPISFAASGPLTVAGDLHAAGGPGKSIILAGSGAVNIAPIPNGAAHYFKPGTNVTVVGGVGGTFSASTGLFTPGDAPGSSTPSATAPTTVTLNLGTSAHPYDLRLSGPNGAAPTVGTMVLANGSIVNNGVLTSSTGNLIPFLQWTGTLTNNGTIINASLESGPQVGRVSFQGNTSAKLAYGGLVNNGAITTQIPALVVDLPGTIINSSGATISNSNVGGSVSLLAGNVALPLFNGVGGAVINHGAVVAYGGVSLVASNPYHVGPNPGGGVFSDGSIQILSSSAHTGAILTVQSATGNAFLGGTVTTPHDPLGLSLAFFQSGRSPTSTFTLGTNVTAQNLVQFTGGSLTGPGTVTTNTLHLLNFTGSVNNVTSPTNYLANGFHVANGTSGNTHIILDMPTTGMGAIGRQVVNLNVAGNATLTSGHTSTFVNGLGSVGILPTEANVGSNLLVQASGNMAVNPSLVGPANYALSTGALHTPGFVFPGGIVLIAGSTLALNTVVDNGYAPTVVAGQGIFFQAPHIVNTAPVITSGNAWVNFSTAPTSAPPILYGVTAAPGGYTIAADPSAYHIRSYMP
ncbi:beta strand repeat-containing protein [Methylacidimicrobium tartarophylax]|uniref:Filamentous haemagglutinin FhaB/tRNA nuclease CdiA-like TPS domain-containing protein n=1 Tax=Methylacidimicrobium tartarophylax TaxID=1041768 RepID=A0A5E6MFG2_9BACT|nr:hypothetical protein [Methylacidimicrobium tartarophylax]VVM06583.1 hypothetical protein MAMT_01295 [Methylacidimicrobium tartarophylax]